MFGTEGLVFRFFFVTKSLRAKRSNLIKTGSSRVGKRKDAKNFHNNQYIVKAQGFYLR